MFKNDEIIHGQPIDTEKLSIIYIIDIKLVQLSQSRFLHELGVSCDLFNWGKANITITYIYERISTK